MCKEENRGLVVSGGPKIHRLVHHPSSKSEDSSEGPLRGRNGTWTSDLSRHELHGELDGKVRSKVRTPFKF